MVLGRRPSKTRGFYVFQFARATLCGLWAGRPSKTRGFLRFSNRPRDPLRTFGWSALENSWFFAIFKSLARPSAEFRVVESLPLWRGAHFLEAANHRCRASGICSRAFLARAPNRGQAIGIASEALLILRKLVFFSIFNSPARPSAEFGLVDLRKLVVFCDFQIARATICGVSRGRIALVVARRYLNRCQASGICTNAN